MASAFDPFRFHRFLNLRTFRSSGAPVETPVWFVQRGDRIWLVTPADAGKLKRIGRNPEVEVAPCAPWGTTLGPWIPARAACLDPGEDEPAARALARRYLAPRPMVAWFYGRRRQGPPVYVELTPA